MLLKGVVTLILHMGGVVALWLVDSRSIKWSGFESCVVFFGKTLLIVPLSTQVYKFTVGGNPAMD